MSTDEDRRQFVAQRVEEGFALWCRVLSQHVDWDVYHKGIVDNAERLWWRQQSRERKKARQTVPLDSLLHEPAAKDYGHAEVEARDEIDSWEHSVRRIAELRLNGFTITEIAEQTAYSERSVKRYLHQARRLLLD